MRGTEAVDAHLVIYSAGRQSLFINFRAWKHWRAAKTRNRFVKSVIFQIFWLLRDKSGKTTMTAPPHKGYQVMWRWGTNTTDFYIFKLGMPSIILHQREKKKKKEQRGSLSSILHVIPLNTPASYFWQLM